MAYNHYICFTSKIGADCKEFEQMRQPFRYTMCHRLVPMQRQYETDNDASRQALVKHLLRAGGSLPGRASAN